MLNICKDYLFVTNFTDKHPNHIFALIGTLVVSKLMS